MPAAKNVLVDRRRPVARPDAAQARRGLPEAAQHRPAVRRGRDLPQPFHPGCALRAGAGQPADRPVPDEPSRGAEHHPARLALHQPGARAARAAATIRRWSATPRPRPIRARPRPTIRASSCWATSWTGFHSVGAFENRDAYFGWVASQGFKLPRGPRGHLAAAGRARRRRHGAARRAIPKELSDTRLVHRARPHLPAAAAPAKPWFLHLGYYRPHPPFIASGAVQRDVPAGGHAQGRARGLAGGGGQAERAARLLCEQHQAGELLPGRQGARLGDDRGSRSPRCARPIAA